ncbi:hypothetical protein [Zhouia amylolytica]|uniref:Beta-lactamase-inhibitor-like PepSY-like domain-containing protein n=1 Tax=Zhouia amylolytica AD3 TaxID=1286632 RepID=W2UMB4_9FLAO|nr:hypothetical protein [Zhouia amylolytica]ETN94606.1 hypothetical protein P278_25490 [Zhouia amylolytica AD3]MCQ0111607.1 hypothetical protein [Zhouia amylolytica]
MKKVVLTIAIILGGLTAQAFTPAANQSKIIKIAQEEYKEIEVSKLPTAVTDAVQKDFAGAKISKAYVNEKGEYKLEISKDGAEKTLYADKDGNWIKKQ